MKSSVDRTNGCIKCGKDGHKIAECPNDAICVICEAIEDGRDSKQRTGCGKCPAYMQAMMSFKRERWSRFCEEPNKNEKNEPEKKNKATMTSG